MQTALLLALPALLIGCAEQTPGAGPPTFHGDVEPIVQRSCQSCHVDGGVAPFSLTTYADARAMADAMVEGVEGRTMPPWGAFPSEDCAPSRRFARDERLSTYEIATIRAWRDAGAPEGESNAPTAWVPIRPQELVDRTVEIAPATPFIVGGYTDQHPCFVVDPGFDHDVYATATFVVPGVREIVHHVLAVADPGRTSADKAEGHGVYECPGGGVDLPGTVPLAKWAPGAEPFELPPGVGIRIPAGSLIVIQVHYHSHGSAPQTDSTRLQLRLTAKRPDSLLLSTYAGNYTKAFDGSAGLLPGEADPPSGPEFRIPANVESHDETMVYTFGGEVGTEGKRLLSISNHMHYLGIHQSVELERKNPRSSEDPVECLLSERWSFDWQRAYLYEGELPIVRKGDKLRITCRYDNAIDSPGTQRALVDAGRTAPVDVFMGNETTDEMCQTNLGFITHAR